ncbi:MAG: DUF1822 family protein [Cyanothece sp. SIO2G6]|nr:DUF1822 family protein [Cyanothece sp. SIO2G6]
MIVHDLQHLDEDSVLVYITQDAYQLAQGFAAQQTSSQKATQVYRNTLAVCAVNNYLRMLGIATDLSHCDSWNPMMRSLINTADLEIVGWGRLECRPLSTAERDATLPTGRLPAEVQTNRVGYVFVHLDDETATLIGFTPTLEETLDSSDEVLPLSRLHPLSSLLQCLEQQQTHQNEIDVGLTSSLTTLSNWFEGAVESEWQTLNTLLGTSELGFAYRHPSDSPTAPSVRMLSRGKALTSFALAGISIALVVHVTRLTDKDVEVNIRLHSLSDLSGLPSDFRVGLVDAEGNSLMEANNADDHSLIELCFEAGVGDRFDLVITCWEERIIERFKV